MGVLRAALVKGRSGGDEVYAAAEETAAELRERIQQLHQLRTETAKASGTWISPARVINSYSSLLLCFQAAQSCKGHGCVCRSPGRMPSTTPRRTEAATRSSCCWRCWTRRRSCRLIPTRLSCCVRTSPAWTEPREPASSPCSGGHTGICGSDQEHIG